MVLTVRKKGCGPGFFEMVAQDMSQVAMESLGSEMTLRLRMGLVALEWMLSWEVRFLCG